jgi:hypothetical protein
VPRSLMLVYAAGGLGKSTLLALTAAHAYKSEGKRTRVVGADGGGTKPFQPLIDKGIVEYWPIDQWDEKSIFANLDFATKGWWPSDLGSINSDLVPPYREWRQCIFCEGDSGAGAVGMVEKCESCKKPFPKGTRLKKKFELLNGMEDVGVYGFEGLTAFGNLLLQRLRKVDPTGGRLIKDEGFNISALGQQHYGDAQTYLAQFVANTRTLPVPIVLWTALELRGDDDGYGKPIYGPKLPGKALTAACIPWFTDVIHLDGQPKKDTSGKEMRDVEGQQTLERKLYLAPHFPPDTKPYGFTAKTSAPLNGGMPTVLDFPPDRNVITTYFEELEKASSKSLDFLLS